ncbi:MAG: tRNA (guanosine(37)-N1)-methyltransferase TrmD [Alteromonadaceae bacterium]|nr:MAG: tRNA (guanosine(37)-N1)-methyltransferase TrmD [Alteromonadaceae bacterium]
MLKVAVVTLFPEMFSAITESGITRRAIANKLVELRYFNPRDYAFDKHRTVDDRPYGGGPGMVMKVEPLKRALDDARQWQGVSTDIDVGGEPDGTTVIYLSPQGKTLDKSGVDEIALCGNLVLLAGRYEGIDERFIEREVDQELSIGDYVLSGGELPAMVLLDAMIRKIPGALGGAQSVEQDSFENGLLDCPHYTRPEILSSQRVPEVLLSGNHEKIARWRHKEALIRTYERRPDMIEKMVLSDSDRSLLDAYRSERED